MRGQPPEAAQVAEMVRLYKSGLSLVRVADRIGVSSKTVLNYLWAEGSGTCTAARDEDGGWQVAAFNSGHKRGR